MFDTYGIFIYSGYGEDMWRHPADNYPVPSGWRYRAHWIAHHVVVVLVLYAWWACILWRI